MKSETPILYIKPGCPWCREARNYFDAHGVTVELRDVYANPDHMNRMIEISDQTKCPTFEFGEFVVADFDVDEFQDALEHAPEVKRQLGLGGDED